MRRNLKPGPWGVDFFLDDSSSDILKTMAGLEFCQTKIAQMSVKVCGRRFGFSFELPHRTFDYLILTSKLDNIYLQTRIWAFFSASVVAANCFGVFLDQSASHLSSVSPLSCWSSFFASSIDTSSFFFFPQEVHTWSTFLPVKLTGPVLPTSRLFYPCFLGESLQILIRNLFLVRLLDGDADILSVFVRFKAFSLLFPPGTNFPVQFSFLTSFVPFPSVECSACCRLFQLPFYVAACRMPSSFLRRHVRGLLRGKFSPSPSLDDAPEVEVNPSLES